jgi:hypothetical protein
MWTRDVQNVLFTILFCGWLGGMGVDGIAAESGKLFTIEEVGKILNGMLLLLLRFTYQQIQFLST